MTPRERRTGITSLLSDLRTPASVFFLSDLYTPRLRSPRVHFVICELAMNFRQSVAIYKCEMAPPARTLVSRASLRPWGVDIAIFRGVRRGRDRLAHHPSRSVATTASTFNIVPRSSSMRGRFLTLRASANASFGIYVPIRRTIYELLSRPISYFEIGTAMSARRHQIDQPRPIILAKSSPDRRAVSCRCHTINPGGSDVPLVSLDAVDLQSRSALLVILATVFGSW